MIINSLTLHNFMSYADASLDLTSFSVACLTGANGSGKSALLDAITWALWEEARASSDELIRLGQSEMWVDLCFSLERQLYRVRRARQKSFTRSGQVSSSRGQLDLQVWQGADPDHSSGGGRLRTTLRPLPVGSDASGTPAALTGGSPAHVSPEAHLSVTDPASLRAQSSESAAITTETLQNTKIESVQLIESGWQSLTASSMRETQKRLRELLRMDYQTFISSVYLRQGRADEFTMRSANERKQVLADILGLDYFERLQEKCKQETRDCKARIQVLEAGLMARADFEQGFADSLANLESIASELGELESSLDVCVVEHTNLESEMAKLNYLQIRADTARTRSAELNDDLASLERRLDELNKQEAKFSQLLQNADIVADKFRQFEECRKEAERLDIKAARHQELKSKRLELNSRLAMHQGRLEVELEHLESLLDSRQERARGLEKNCLELPKQESAYREYRRLLDAELEMSRKRESFATLTARAAELQSMISESRVRMEMQIQQKELLLIELEQILSGRSQIEAEQLALKNELGAIDRLEAEFELVEDKGIKVKSQVEALQQQIVQLKKYIRENEEKVHELCQTPDLSTCPLCRAPIVDSKAVLDRYEKDKQGARADVDNLETQINMLCQERDTLRKQYIELRKKLAERKNIDVRIGEFNERQLAIERALSTREEIRAEIERARLSLEQHSFAPVEKESLIRVKAELSKLEFDPVVFSSFQAQMRSQRYVEMRYQQLQKDHHELDELNKELPVLQEKIRALKEELQSGKFGGEERHTIEELDAAIAELGYDRFKHQEIKNELALLLPFAEKIRDIERAQEILPDLQRNCLELSAMLSARRQELQHLEHESQEWSSRLQEIPQLKVRLEEETWKREELELKRNDHVKRKILLETQLQSLERDRSELDSKKQMLADAIKEMSDYSTLAEAFGKKGIQAIIIENAIPEIEAEANRLLGRLSDNRMHLNLITQQRTRQGNPVETLDILIADELGTRNYELYSGGEAFKVNFALRVALSRFLARRAGAKLETLIIDEGFGSQDEDSRAKVIRAISSIKSDFARIIVVTHIGEVKEMFPTQIAVSKADGVSRLSLNC